MTFNYDAWKLATPPTIDLDAIEESSGDLLTECVSCERWEETSGRDLASARKLARAVCTECGDVMRATKWTINGNEEHAL